MAERPKGYGMTSELKDKQAAKYDPRLEAEAKEWLKALVKEPWPASDFHQALHDGVYLCKAMNVIQPGSIPKIQTSTMAFKKMENIGNFLTAAGKLGVPAADLFQTVDLYDAANMNQVVSAIHALGRAAQKKGPAHLPKLGVKEAVKNTRNFDPSEQKASSQSVIGLQMGSNRGASQAGMTPYGLQRQVEKTNLKT